MKNQPSPHPLIRQMISEPETFTAADISTLLGIDLQNPSDDPFQGNELINTSDLKYAILRIFDQNDDFRFDNAYTGYLGPLNNWSLGRRKNKFVRRIKANPRAIKLVAEGDSWFEHPISRDVIDWLNILGKEDMAIFSLARGGDFLTNMLKEREYITEVSLIDPDFFLLSAGGIEIVTGWRVSLLVTPKADYVTDTFLRKHPLLQEVLCDPDLSDSTKQRLENGIRLLNREYFALLALLELKYKYLIKQLRKKFRSLKMICHGYDYPIPSFDRGPWSSPKQRLIRMLGDHGRHFKQPLLIKGIIDPQNQQDIAFSMLYLFNEMLQRLVKHPIFGENVYLIDCRGYARPQDWEDELHLRPESLKRVAETYISCIRDEVPGQKIYFVRRDS